MLLIYHYMRKNNFTEFFIISIIYLNIKIYVYILNLFIF